MYCGKCGHKIQENMQYCIHCGAKLEKQEGLTKAFKNGIEESLKPETAKHNTTSTIMFLAISAFIVVVGLSILLNVVLPPKGALVKKLRYSRIVPSEQAKQSNYIDVPFIDDFGLDTYQYETNGLGTGVMTYEDATQESLSGEGSTKLEIDLKKDNTFEMHLYDTYVYGEYHYDEEASEVYLSKGEENYYAPYDGSILTIYSNDGSMFEFM